MTAQDAIAVLKAELIVAGEGITKKVNHIVASDLMSDVLLVDEEDMLLLTSLASDQVLRTAHIVGAVAVVVVNGKALPSTMKQVAKDLGMTLALAQQSKYDACIALHLRMNA